MDCFHALYSRYNVDETIVASFLLANIYYQETPNDYLRDDGIHRGFEPHLPTWHGSPMCKSILFRQVFHADCFLESNTRDMDKLDVQGGGTHKMHRCIRCGLRSIGHQHPPQPHDPSFPDSNSLETGTLLAQKGKSHDHVFCRIIRPHLQFKSTSHSAEDGVFD